LPFRVPNPFPLKRVRPYLSSPRREHPIPLPPHTHPLYHRKTALVRL
jgi:hypothetical protein